jgi:outer membrane protein TolC
MMILFFHGKLAISTVLHIHIGVIRTRLRAGCSGKDATMGRTISASSMTLCLVFGCIFLGENAPPSRAQPAAQLTVATSQPEAEAADPQIQLLPPPRIVEDMPFTSSDGIPGALPISFLVALRLSGTRNLDIAQGREVVNQFQANYARALASWLPNFNIGSTYTYHFGNIAKTEGNIIKANKDSLFVGGGPSLVYSVTDMIYAPLVARQTTMASRAGMQRVTQETVQTVAGAYFNLLRARRRLARVEETLEFLTSDQPAAARAKSKGLLPLVRNFVELKADVALRAELERVRVEVLKRQEERAAAWQDLRIASAELARLLRLDPEIPLWPIEDFRFPLALPGDQWSTLDVPELINVALANRPELAENQALVQAALRRVQAARSRPFLPNVIVNYNWGDFGGAPDINTKPTTFFSASGQINHFNTRSDFDAALIWRLQNLGMGDLANMREAAALHRQTQFRQMQVQERIVAEIVQAQESVRGWRQRLEITARSLFDAKGEPTGPVFQALRLNFDRIFNVPGTRPLEVLDSIRGLNDLLDSYGQAATEYERARFRLLIALGLPAQQIIGPEGPPPPPGSITPNGP